MKNFLTEQIRNVAVIGHGSVGKTTLLEAMMYQTGVIGRMGRIDAGTTLSDSDPDETHRKISISTALLPVFFNEHKLNMLDTPGYADFLSEVVSTLHVADGAIFVIDAVNGVEVQTERYWRMAEGRRLARLLFINKMDKEHADFDQTMISLKQRFGNGVVAVQLPIGSQSSFTGYVDLIHMKAYLESEGNELPVASEIPAELQSLAVEMRNGVMEAAAEANDDLMMKYLEEGELSDDEIVSGLQQATRAGRVFPVLVGSAYKNFGTTALLQMIIDTLPSAAMLPVVTAKQGEEEISLPVDAKGPLAAYVFKTEANQFAGRISYLRIYSGTMTPGMEAYNVQKSHKERIGGLFVLVGKHQDAAEAAHAGDIIQVAKLHDTLTTNSLSSSADRLEMPAAVYPEPMLNFSIAPATKGEEDKLAQGMHRFVEEDPTLKFEQDPETHEAVIAGMGELQIEIIRDRLKRKFNVVTLLGNPAVAYRETIRTTAEGHGRHKKQSGGAGQFGDVKVRFEPLERGSGFEFADEVVGGVVPRQYIPSVEKGLRESIKRGPIAGYPVIDIRAALFDGSYHPVDSKDIAFQMAARLAYHEAMPKAMPVLLEPFVDVEVVVPDEYIGDIIGGISGKRGRVQGSDSTGVGMSVVKAQAPQAEMFQYANELRALTQGRGSFTMTISHYEEVPPHVAEEISASAKKHSEEEH